MTVYSHPGVFVEEIPTLPPSVAPVATAIPAFIGYTEKRLDDNGKDAGSGVVTRRISTFIEYKQYFGGANPVSFNLIGGKIFQRKEYNTALNDDDLPAYLMYYALKLYFDNGGGPCYIISIGEYDGGVTDSDFGDFEQALTSLKGIDEPTIIVHIDAIKMNTRYYGLCAGTLLHCSELKNRFAIFDFKDNNSIQTEMDAFRLQIGNNYLHYGSVYAPYLHTGQIYSCEDKEVLLGGFFWRLLIGGTNGLVVYYNDESSHTPQVFLKGSNTEKFAISITNPTLTIKGLTRNGLPPVEILTAWNRDKKEGFYLALQANSPNQINNVYAGGEYSLEVEVKAVDMGKDKLAIVYDDTTSHTAKHYQIKLNEKDEFNFEIILGKRIPSETLVIYLPSSTPEEGTEAKNIINALDKFDLGDFRIFQNGTGKGMIQVTNDAQELSVNFYSGIIGASSLKAFYKKEIARVITNADGDLDFKVDGSTLTISGIPVAKTAKEIVAIWQSWLTNPNNDPSEFSLHFIGDGTDNIIPLDPPLGLATSVTLENIKDTHTQLYNQYRAELAKKRVVLPPSAAIAGIYASVDRDRGVWKAPANVSISSIVGPLRHITDEEQDRLNVDPQSGKSINAIRSFAGKGTMVWGARTLAGNDNEWRYIPVRRLFIFIEESLRKATQFAIFEPNTATTWLKVKAMAESFLYNLWQRGALAGATPQAAYYVNVGLGKTMTPQDILEGRMYVEIGVAAARPAEFVILRFMHKLQQS